MRTLIVIPARLNSQRLPRKVLLAETGKALIVHVVEQAKKSRHCNPDCPPLIAFDTTEEGYADLYHAHCGTPICRTKAHPNGTSRAAEAFNITGQQFDAVCIVQADCPEISPALMDSVIEQLEQHPEWDCATAVRGQCSSLSAGNQNIVKALVKEPAMIAVDFRREIGSDWPVGDHMVGHHIGIYCYRREALMRYAAAGPCEREQSESLEQLRALHIGLKMGVVLTDEAPAGIDTREDYKAFVDRWRATHG